MNQFGGKIDYGKSQYPPILGPGQNGGTCNTCLQIPVVSPTQSGGNFYKPAAPVPGPFVGQAWGTSVNQWPGVDGVGANRNYLSPIGKVIDNDPALQMLTPDIDAGYRTLNSMVGGYEYNTSNETKKKENKKKKSNRRTTSNASTKSTATTKSISSSSKNSSLGGGLIPQDLLNLGSDVSYNVKSAYNALNGYSAPVNPLPYKDQLTR